MLSLAIYFFCLFCGCMGHVDHVVRRRMVFGRDTWRLNIDIGVTQQRHNVTGCLTEAW